MLCTHKCVAFCMEFNWELCDFLDCFVFVVKCCVLFDLLDISSRTKKKRTKKEISLGPFLTYYYIIRSHVPHTNKNENERK